jgi:hypothetical protein
MPRWMGARSRSTTTSPRWSRRRPNSAPPWPTWSWIPRSPSGADNRLDELNRLIQLKAADRIPSAIMRLNQAVEEAVRDTSDASQTRALEGNLAAVTAGSVVALQRLQDKLDQGMLPASARQAITDAIRQAPVTPDPRQPTPTTDGSTVTTSTGSPTTTQAPTTEASDVSTSPDRGGNGDRGQGSSGETAATLP